MKDRECEGSDPGKMVAHLAHNVSMAPDKALCVDKTVLEEVSTRWHSVYKVEGSTNLLLAPRCC